MKIATIIGTRPQFIKAAPVSEIIKKNNNDLKEIIIHTGQHYEKNMSEVFFNQLNMINPKYDLNINQIEYGNMIEKMFIAITRVLQIEKTNAVLVYGDTSSTLAGALAAKRLKLPIFHIEAGLRSYNRMMYEECNRVITDHMSSLLFCPTKTSVNNLLKENISEKVFFVGDVMYDSFLRFKSLGLKKNLNYFNSKYILATIHRRENITSKSKLSSIFNSLDKINETTKVIMPLHPHTKNKIKEYDIKSNIVFIGPSDYFTMLSLLIDCDMVITDSGGLQKESFFAKKKCIILRGETEWVELLVNGSSIISSPAELFINYKSISEKSLKFTENYFGDGKASELIVDHIKSFI